MRSVNSLMRVMPSKCIISVPSRQACGEVEVYHQQVAAEHAGSATSAYFSTPPSRSIIIMRSATSVGDSGRAFTLFTVGTANLDTALLQLQIRVRPPSSNGFIGVRRQRTLKPVRGASRDARRQRKSRYGLPSWTPGHRCWQHPKRLPNLRTLPLPRPKRSSTDAEPTLPHHQSLRGETQLLFLARTTNRPSRQFPLTTRTSCASI